MNRLYEEEKKLHFSDVPYHSDMVGAQRALFGIKDATIIVHSPVGCFLYLAGNQSLHGGPHGSYGPMGTTALAERDVVFGGEEKLRKALERSLEVFAPKMIGVIESTVSRLIGDDVAGVIYSFKRETGTDIPVFSVKTSSIEGDHITGFNQVLDALVQNVMKEPEKKLNNTVNILGITEDAPNARADCLEITRLLRELGVKVQVPFLCEVTTEQIRTAPQARLNVVLSETLGCSAARLMEEKFGIPFIILDYPIGITNTTRLLKSVASFFRIGEERVNQVVEKEMDEIYRVLQAALIFAEDIPGMRVAIISDSTPVLAFTRFLKEDLGMEPVLACLKTGSDESLKRLEALEKEMGLNLNVLYKPSYFNIRRALEGLQPNFILGGKYEQHTAEQIGLLNHSTFISIPAFPPTMLISAYRYHTFVGFLGVAYLIELFLNEQSRLVIAPQNNFRENELVRGY